MIGHYLLFPAIASLAGAAMAGVGLLISVSSRSAVQAQGTAVFAWFGFVLLYDLLLIGSLAASGMPAEWLAGALVANPVDAARVLGVLALEPDLYLLGPAGAYIAARFSRAGRRRPAARGPRLLDNGAGRRARRCDSPCRAGAAARRDRVATQALTSAEEVRFS